MKKWFLKMLLLAIVVQSCVYEEFVPDSFSNKVEAGGKFISENEAIDYANKAMELFFGESLSRSGHPRTVSSIRL